jgi:uncharacterized cupin superfamily protein
MQPVNEDRVSEEHRQSPKGKYEIFRRHLTPALGGKRDIGAWDGGHPFDVELARIPPGKANYPLHAHAAQTEYYIILSGTGSVRDGQGKTTTVTAGDHFICLPGEAHQITNPSEADLVYYVIADNHRADVTTYPDSGKRQVKPEYRVGRLVDADYYEGEE